MLQQITYPFTATIGLKIKTVCAHGIENYLDSSQQGKQNITADKKVVFDAMKRDIKSVQKL